jgi:hypothetical protein
LEVQFEKWSLKMKNKLLLVIISILALVSLACRVSINLPYTDVKTGPTQREEILVELPEGERVSDLTLMFGAGELKLQPGDQDYLVEGMVSYNVADFKPVVKLKDERVSIEQGSMEVRGIPAFSSKIYNTWDFKIGRAPMDLTIQAGGYQGNLELGGIEIQRLEISDGASDVELRFSEANPADMETFRYTTGASNLKIYGLSNANFSNMIFRSGAGNYTLDFSGDLKKDAQVQIESGLSNIMLIVPAGVNASLSYEGALTNLEVRGNWRKSGDAYVTGGSGPQLKINIKMGAGNIEIANR